MRKTSVFIISLLLFGIVTNANAQNPTLDSLVNVPLNIKIGVDISGPIIHAFNKDNTTYEGFISVDYNEKISFAINGGYSTYDVMEYLFYYKSKGFYFKPGVDINFLKPQLSQGIYWGGLGVRYGMSFFSFETPSFRYSDIWGTNNMSIPSENRVGHFIELAPGFQANLTKHITLGWRVTLSKILYSGSKKDIKPMMIPGYGNRDNGVSFGFKYYIGFNLPYKNIKAKFKEDNSGASYDSIEDTDTETDSFNMF